MSIRLRLTLLYSLILILTLLAFSVAIYRGQALSSTGGLQHMLADNTSHLVQSRLVVLTGGVANQPPPPPGSSDNRPGRPPGPVQQIRQLDGTVQAQTDGQTPLPLSAAGLKAVSAGRPWVEKALVDGERYLIYSRPGLVDGQVSEIAQVGQSIANEELYLSALASTLLIASAFATLLAFGAGWAMAGFVLRPIDHITRTARSIGADQDLSRRIDYRNPNDEIGQLAKTLNGMLAQLQTAYQQVDGALQMQRRFVADVSHELRTPLTTLHGNIELLRREPPINAADRVEILTDMAAESQRLIGLVRDLLALARADASPPLRSEPVRCVTLVAEVCSQARLLDPSRTIGGEPPPDVAVLADAHALRQVFLILLDNAIKHAVGAITLTTRALDQSVAFSVRDEGPGIPPEIQTRIFERFFRGVRGDVDAGSGLGLAIARSLVEAQHGTLAVESQVGVGSVFTVTLPRATLRD